MTTGGFEVVVVLVELVVLVVGLGRFVGLLGWLFGLLVEVGLKGGRLVEVDVTRGRGLDVSPSTS